MCSKIYMEDIDAVALLICECIKSLEGLEKEIVRLETHSDNLELLNRIFECIHCIKRESSFFGLVDITRLTYEMEAIMEAIKNRNAIVDSELIDSLLLGVDFLNSYTKRLYDRLKELDSSQESTVMYLEFSSSQKEQQLLKDIEAAHEKYTAESEKESILQDTSNENKIEFSSSDILMSEEFKNELAEDMKEQFLLESSEHLEKIENDLLIRLDSNKNDREAINEIFRAVHSIKGGAGVYLAILLPGSQLQIELIKFVDVVHTFENLLSIIRDKECDVERNMIDLSLAVIDYLKIFLSSLDTKEVIFQKNHSILIEIKQEIQKIQGIQGIQGIQEDELISGNKGQDTSSALRAKSNEPQEAKAKSSVAQSIRVNQDKIDKMMNTISELIIAKNSFAHIAEKLNLDYNLPEISKEVKQVGAYVNRISNELQNAIMSIRMLEIKTIFQKMPRVIRDIAQSTGKKMELFVEGETTEIDKTIIEQISDPLVHIIRNSADHGIEHVEERLKKGKPEKGKIVLRAYNKNNYVFIEIEDDGKGIDTQSIKRKALEKGIITEREAERMDHSQLLNLIFLPGFSLAKQITEVSGRGVGMDIVKSNITKIKGKITIEGEVDKGTKIIIQLPLSLAISRGLTVEVSGETYIIPLENVVETVKIKKSRIHNFNEKYFTYLRGTVIGMEWLCKVFLIGERDLSDEELNAVILSNGIENYAIVVDKLKNEQEFVVKALEGHLSAIPGISGSTLLGNGQVVLIINPNDILQLATSQRLI